MSVTGELRHGSRLGELYAARRAGVSTNRPAKVQREGAGLVTVPMADEAEHVVRERLYALEAAVAQDAALKDAEPNLDLVNPRSVQRRVDEAKPATVLFVEASPAIVAPFAMQIEVDDVDAATLVPLRDRVHERQQRVGVAATNDAAEDLARAHVKRRQ